MRSYRIIILMVALLTLLTLATGGFAQRVNPDDRDGDGLPNIADQCPDVAGPRENRGCPLATATPVSGPVADRDGDGVQDFVDRCPDQPGTGFTEGCPTDQGAEQPAGTPQPERAQQPVFVWWVDDRCLVANRGSENVNVRDGVPDDRSRANVIDALRPGEQFAPLYVLFDASNTPWYGALGFGEGRLQGLGWVSGAVTVAHGDCANLGAPPNTPPRADQTVCVLIVTAEAGATVFSEALPDAAQVETLPHGAYLPAANVHTDERGDLWYQVAPGWLRGIDVTTAGNCTFNNETFLRVFSPIDQITVDEPSLADLFATCVLTTLPGQTMTIYYAPVHDPALIASILPSGTLIEPSGYGMDSSNHLWYALGGRWVDSAEVQGSGGCGTLPLHYDDVGDCQLWLGSAVDLFEKPASDSTVIGSLAAGLSPLVNAEDYDSNAVKWYYLSAFQGWVISTSVSLVNPSNCDDLPLLPEPPSTDDCVLTTVGDGAGLWAAPSHDGAGLYAGGHAGAVYVAVGIEHDANEHLWYNVGGAWIDSDDVVTSGGCASLPVYKPTDYSQCEALIPDNGPGLYLFKDYLSNPLEVVAFLPGPGRVEAAFAATDAQGTRWYHVRYDGAGNAIYGWANSSDVIEMVPSLCDDLPPMVLLPPDLIDIDLQPIVWKP